jgi:O-antigen ligase
MKTWGTTAAVIRSQAMPAPFTSTSIDLPSGFLNAEAEVRDPAGLCFSAARTLLLVALLAAPLAFGAVQAWAWTSLSLVVCVVLILWALGSMRQRTVVLVWSPLYVPALAFILLGALQVAGHTTSYTQGTREALLKLTTEIIVFFSATQLWSGQLIRRPVFGRPKLWNRLGVTLTVYSFLLSLFAILQYFSSRGLIYWKLKTDGWVFGPYVNHNHYAGLMEMLIPVAIAYGFSRPKNHKAHALVGFAVLLPVVSVLLSGSRGGCISLFIELSMMAAVVAWRSSPHDRRRYVTAGVLGILPVTALSFWLGAGAITKRLETIDGLARSPEVTLGDRLLVAHDTLRIFYDHRWMGVGLGSFATVFPQYQSFATDLVFHHAHNDYEEALAETGIAGGLLILIALMIFLHQAFRTLRAGPLSGPDWIQWGAVLGCCGLLVHSLCDFNLHIPANAAWFAFLLGISQAGFSFGKQQRLSSASR